MILSRSHTIYISVGSNVDKEKHTKAGLQGMYQAFGELTLSSVFESESVGFEGNNFYNLVVKASTTLSIAEVCSVLKKIEQDNKRQRGEQKFAPRTLDLDLLLYDTQVTSQPITLPRPEVLYNAFVLKPLAEIAAMNSILKSIKVTPSFGKHMTKASKNCGRLNLIGAQPEYDSI